MVSHDMTKSFHDKLLAGLRVLAKYDGLTPPQFNDKMGNENAVNLLWIILDNDLADTDAELFGDGASKVYKLTKKGKQLMVDCLSGKTHIESVDLLIR